MARSLLFLLFFMYPSSSWVLPGGAKHEKSYIQRTDFELARVPPVPLARLSPRPNQYPLSAPCKGGVRCSPKCKQCTGKGCSNFELEGLPCCSSSVGAEGKYCRLDQGPPCICTHKQVMGKYCNKDVCCAQECGGCGGTNCGRLPGGKKKCCVSSIMDSKVYCTAYRRTACIL